MLVMHRRCLFKEEWTTAGCLQSYKQILLVSSNVSWFVSSCFGACIRPCKEAWHSQRVQRF